MASSCRIEMRFGTRLLTLFLATCALLPWNVASAHVVRPAISREIVRIQGFRATLPGKTRATQPGIRQVIISAGGTESRFTITEWQIFGVEGTPGAPSPEERDRYVLQAAPNIISRFNAARPKQRVTVIAERRPGAPDMFVLALDLCPPQ